MNRFLTLGMLRSGLPVSPGTILLRAEGDRSPSPGPGTILAGDGTTLVAAVSGLAMIATETAWVFPAEIYRGDLYQDGQLSVAGNLIVTGGLRAGAKIRAGGSVGIRGNVHYGRIEALGSIATLSGCHGSLLSAGANTSMYQFSCTRLETLMVSLGQLTSVIRQLWSHPGFETRDLQTNLQPLLQVLVERSFSGLPSQISEAIKRCQLHAHLGGAVVAFRSMLEERFSGTNLLKVAMEQIEQATYLAREALSELVAVRDTGQNIWLHGQAVDSNLEATGLVHTEGGDCQHCTVVGGTGVQVKGTVFGGSVTATEWIEAKAVTGGSSLELNSPGEIRVDSLHTGTLVRVGHLSTRVSGVVSPATVHVWEGRLQLRRYEEVAGNVRNADHVQREP